MAANYIEVRDMVTRGDNGMINIVLLLAMDFLLRIIQHMQLAMRMQLLKLEKSIVQVCKE